MGVPDCRECAACCTARALYVRVSGDDWERLGDAAEELTTWVENRAFLRVVAGACIALDRSEPGRFSCRSYVDRPELCRTLERGSAACLAEIERKGAASSLPR